ncbi:hypothetical protein ONZ43_g947 [Nemania bipapillata]|uniref:Uncharacterized protein n=1 Tax=Nemania bipapillata TaxID=110536 RepID=A0ACC2J6F5_9PEZI|nr:hypothetical protein ONZ43_g947 [Nemania bipapillata]
MAEHPHGYGQYLGHYPPASFPSSSTSQTPYYYPAPQAGTLLPTDYTASQSAYNLNSTRIPGLGLGRDAPMTTTTAFPTGASQPWPAQGHHSQTNNHFQSQQQPPPSLPRPSVIPPQPPHNTLEEGELSEGEFDDLYDPKVLNNPSQAPAQSKAAQPANNLGSRNGSVGDADGSSIYDPHDEHAVQATSNNLPRYEQDSPPDDDWEPSYQDRERSGSYSPYLSPREVHRKISVVKAISRDTRAADRVESSQSAHHTVTSPNADKTTLPASTAPQEPPSSGSLPFRSPLEAKKKAQEAILGLWSFKVRYQDYIDEGVDSNVIKALFKDIGLDIPVSKTALASVPSQATSEAQLAPTKAISPSKTPPKPQDLPIPKTQAPPPDTKQPDNKDDKNEGSKVKPAGKSAAEERKDKIARKLAAMAQKATSTQPSGPVASTPIPVSAPIPSSTPVPVPVSIFTSTTAPAPAPAPAPSPTPVSVSAPLPALVPASAAAEAPNPAVIKPDVTNTPPITTKTRAENNAILQQKLAALKKQQAQLAADKVRITSNESTATSSPVAPDLGSLDTSRNGDSTPKARPAISAQQILNQANLSNEAQSNSKSEGIPGLSFSSLPLPQPSQGSGRNLKRPVASDFDNYTPRFEQLKRTRTEERLVIDVSDDEDVEMEIGSPIDEVAPSTDSGGAAARQALATFPPLSDGPNRQQKESPASSSAPTPTPPVHGARIDLLHKRIEETKRRIAEAEAKKAAKKVIASLSPKPSSPVPQPINPFQGNESVVDGRRSIDNRRERIVSYELPRVTATLKEKQDRLRLLAAEAAQLEREVQATLDEQQKLSAEVECLVESSTALSPRSEKRPQSSNGKSSELEPIEAAELQASPQYQGHTAASGSQLDRREENLDEPQLPSRQQSPSVSMNGHMDIEPNQEEALQAAIVSEDHIMDLQMDDVETAGPDTDNAQVTNKTLATNPSESLEPCAPAQSSATVLEHNKEHARGGVCEDADIEADVIAQSTPIGISAPPSESDSVSGESDVSMQQSAGELSQSDDESYEPTPPRISDFHGTQEDEQHSTEIIDDILEEPNPNHTSADQNDRKPENTTEDVYSNTPTLEDLLSYKSPLSYFRAYRFHPKYFEDVPGGLKSMTFSAKIDPMREVCSHVLAGEPCPKGTSCEYQHFDSMVLPDAEIITQLGSAEMFVGETKTKFIAGLKRVLNDLKANRVKDFDRITRAIVKHRQEFLGDKTKVLALDSSAT